MILHALPVMLEDDKNIFCPTSMQHCSGGANSCYKARKKMLANWKERSKMFPICKHVITYVE